uniref:Saposin B-type domain-containing protein n=1 Tax=Panagrolaimus sp. JU765 TaxID=591449 RepID=A0AC34Q4X1_9BILA
MFAANFVLCFLLGLIAVDGFDKFDQMRLESLKFNQEECRQAVRTGRETVRRVAENLSLRHLEKRDLKLKQARQKYFRAIADKRAQHRVFSVLDGQTPATKNCSDLPMSTLFPIPTRPPTTVSQPSTSPTTTQPTTTSASSTASTSAPKPKSAEFRPHPMFVSTPNDPFLQLMNHFHSSLDEEAFCNGPKITDMFSISDGQILGFMSTFLANDAKYLCPICHGFASHFHRGVLHSQKLSMAHDERFLYESALAHVPDPETLCSALVPVCHEDYETLKKNITPALDCIHCTVCNTFSITIVQKVITEQLRGLFSLLFDEFVFKNICAEICLLDTPPANQTFDYSNEQACRNFLKVQFDWLYTAIRRYLLPNNFCAFQMGVCEINENPNIIHCLKELCDEALTHPLNIICPLIPDAPDDVQRFLNIQKPTKTAKSWQKTKTEL